jgi:hypothetical protein
MADLPLYDPSGTRRTEATRPNAVSADSFGAPQARAAGIRAQAQEGIGRAMVGLGGQIAQAGEGIAAALQKRQDLEDATSVIDANTEATSRMRHALYGKDGIYTRTGKNATGMTDLVASTSETIRADIEKRLSTDAQRKAFSQMWGRYTESALNSAAGREFNQMVETSAATKTAALANISADVVANYNDTEMLTTNFDAAKRIIRANPEGLPQELVTQIERETMSSLHLQVIGRLAQDNPGKALEYYTKNKAGVSGADHAKADGIISGVAQAQAARLAADEIANTGPAGDIMRFVVGAESGGDPAAVSPAGAAGLAQLMPDTARAEAAALGMSAIAGMNDEELKAHWSTPQGQRDNVRIGSTYLNKQLTSFGGDLEAALIAYNAGPANARKWLDAGRDYAALPKPEETLPYVRKILSAYSGKEISGEGSADFQETLRGGQTYYRGEAATASKRGARRRHDAGYARPSRGAHERRARLCERRAGHSVRYSHGRAASGAVCGCGQEVRQREGGAQMGRASRQVAAQPRAGRRSRLARWQAGERAGCGQAMAPCQRRQVWPVVPDVA